MGAEWIIEVLNEYGYQGVALIIGIYLLKTTVRFLQDSEFTIRYPRKKE